MMTTDDEVFLQDWQLAEKLGLAKRSVWRMCRDGRLPKPYRFGKRCSRWRWHEVLLHVEKVRTSGGAA
jgi:predicted DNA-binding transcriptional regulator AlpA